jgi:hypothetical protein
MNFNAKMSSSNIFPRAAHYISKSRMWLASRDLATPGIENNHVMPLNMYEFRGARYNESHALLKGVNEISHVLYAVVFRFT